MTMIASSTSARTCSSSSSSSSSWGLRSTSNQSGRFIPDDMLIEIFTFLNNKEISAASGTCHQFEINGRRGFRTLKFLPHYKLGQFSPLTSVADLLGSRDLALLAGTSRNYAGAARAVSKGRIIQQFGQAGTLSIFGGSRFVEALPYCATLRLSSRRTILTNDMYAVRQERGPMILVGELQIDPATIGAATTVEEGGILVCVDDWTVCLQCPPEFRDPQDPIGGDRMHSLLFGPTRVHDMRCHRDWDRNEFGYRLHDRMGPDYLPHRIQIATLFTGLCHRLPLGRPLWQPDGVAETYPVISGDLESNSRRCCGSYRREDTTRLRRPYGPTFHLAGTVPWATRPFMPSIVSTARASIVFTSQGTLYMPGCQGRSDTTSTLSTTVVDMMPTTTIVATTRTENHVTGPRGCCAVFDCPTTTTTTTTITPTSQTTIGTQKRDCCTVM